MSGERQNIVKSTYRTVNSVECGVYTIGWSEKKLKMMLNNRGTTFDRAPLISTANDANGYFALGVHWKYFEYDPRHEWY